MSRSPVQLELPLAGMHPTFESSPIPRARRIFVNRNLKMATIDWVGFDMDYTLAIYNQPAMDRLSIRATVAKLVARGYPGEILNRIEYPLDFAIRGLLIDKRYGNVLKMDRFKVVQKGYHGLRELTKEEIRSLYHQKRIRPQTARYHWIDTLYALSEVTMYAAVIDMLDRLGEPVDYDRLFTDIRECIDEAHRDGTILDEVIANLPLYVERDPTLASTLHKLRSAGKKLFLLTNSRWPYTEQMMTYLLGGAMPEYPSFRNYFDLIIVGASKPAFFRDRRPLVVRVPEPGKNNHANGKSEAAEPIADPEPKPAAAPLDRGAVYEGGNLQDFERFLDVTGDRILYVGDHIYGDILRSKKDSVWRTAMIIQEMEAEVSAHEGCREEHNMLVDYEERREQLEDELRYHQQSYKEAVRKIEGARAGAAQQGENAEAKRANGAAASALEAERMRIKRAVERIRGQLRIVDGELLRLEREISKRFHPYWGSLLKEANETSSFGAQVEEYACLYTSRVSNLWMYSPLQFFRSARDLMPHEL